MDQCKLTVARRWFSPFKCPICVHQGKENPTLFRARVVKSRFDLVGKDRAAALEHMRSHHPDLLQGEEAIESWIEAIRSADCLWAYHSSLQRSLELALWYIISPQEACSPDTDIHASVKKQGDLPWSLFPTEP
jgi:hypothetical protein